MRRVQRGPGRRAADTPRVVSVLQRRPLACGPASRRNDAIDGRPRTRRRTTKAHRRLRCCPIANNHAPLMIAGDLERHIDVAVLPRSRTTRRHRWPSAQRPRSLSPMSRDRPRCPEARHCSGRSSVMIRQLADGRPCGRRCRVDDNVRARSLRCQSYSLSVCFTTARLSNPGEPAHHHQRG